ncbi:unnamed protein product [Eruca vesicaria subsp. sativa]|uniref:F-box domain-containing protein n=1 Tax=Eruca vesicaria subsp. sativa TaxID=29727 RepID=A0ABC8JQT7_ERUVS|nr:unnamed protein product [Eruca vesicaria subsp. sativa]
MIPKEAKPNQTETNTEPQPLSFLSLPEEIIENILARLSKWTYPNLSLVSKRFLSLLSSPKLYTTRSHIKTTEPCLYFCLEDLPQIPFPKWFTLWMRPADETITNDDEILEDYSLVSVPSCPNLQHIPYYSTVSVGSDIYLIGAPYKAPPSSLVRIFDCRSHTWRDGPSMLVAREGAAAFHIDGKIYVMEAYRKDDNWMEVLDLKTHSWSPLLSHGATEFRDHWFIANVFRGKIYLIAETENFAYDPKEGTWEVVETHTSYVHIDAWCAIDDVMFCFTSSGYCLWYDSQSREWKEVKGTDMEVLRGRNTEISLAWGCVHEMVDHGGKLLVIWIPKSEEYKAKPERRIWCAKIAFEKCHEGVVWGKLEWVNEVLTVTKSFNILSCAVVTI